MPTYKTQVFPSAPQGLSQRMSKEFKSKEVAPKLVRNEISAMRITPSVFEQEMVLSTEQRLAKTFEMHPPRILELLDMSMNTHHKFSSVDMDQALFQPYPCEIVFQNYSPSNTYNVPLALRNNDKVPRMVKVVVEESMYFQVVNPAAGCNKVAPGMVATFTVLFTPQENKDYMHRLICVTEREKFEVPIRAIGPRAILDFPDQVYFPLCPVKCMNEKILLVRNVGTCEAKFQLRTCSPFSVDPSLGTLGLGETMQITVNFLPKTSGDHYQDLVLHYHTGEDIYISLYGAAADVDVKLDQYSVTMEKTYISLASQHTVSILNKSDAIVHYHWKSFATEEEEQQHKLRLKGVREEQGDDMDEFLNACKVDPTEREHFMHLYRTFQAPHREQREERPAFCDQHILMDPLEGEIWPNCSAEVNIIFKPQEARTYQQIIYCDVTGRETRLPLHVQGEGLGPKPQFNFDVLDVGNIFIGSKHSYEVLVTNKGLIDACYRLVEPSTAMGLCFSFNPREGRVPPGACHALEVGFTSNILGVFSEEFHFIVVGSPQPAILTFKGCVVGPTFHFSVPELNFGEVSFGFPQSLTCLLHNTSLVPMTFQLRVPGDGSWQPSVTSETQMKDFSRTDWRLDNTLTLRPIEFTITPRSGTIRAMSRVSVQVTLCSNTRQDYNLALIVDVKGVGEEVLALPIKARCVVPEVVLESSELQLQQCFLDYSYEQSVKLINNSDLPACYGLLPQDDEVQPSLVYYSPHPRGVIQPHSSEQIPLVVRAKAVGKQQLTAHVAILGQQDPPLELLLSCTTEGPLVDCTPAKVDFGRIPVLTDVSRTLRLSNRSPIPGRFLAQMTKARPRWRVEPSEGIIPAEGELELNLVAHLDDTLPFQDELQLVVEFGQTYTIPVSATGKGTTIVSNRPFAPSLDLGTHFSSGPCRYHFKLTNRGRRYHQLYWSTEGFSSFRHRAHLPNDTSKDKKKRGHLAPPALEPPVFHLSPMRLDLAPGHTAAMILEGSSDCERVVQEKLVCHAIVGQQSGKECIMTVDVTCRFVSPVVDISPRQLSFYIKKAPDDVLVPKYQKLAVRNISSLALSLDLTLNEPFGLCDCSDDNSFTTSKRLSLGLEEQRELWVRFDPSCHQDSVSRVAEEVLEVRYQGHPRSDVVPLRGEVHFPNLHFSSTTLDFGCVLNLTEAKQQVTITNCSPLCVTYRWAFILDQQDFPVSKKENLKLWLKEEHMDEKNSDSENENRERGERATSHTTNKHLTVQEVFDILPTYGVLQPDESQLVSFTFFGHVGISSQVLALCEVEGGPAYEVLLRGEASQVTYTLDTTDINFGMQLFDSVAEAEITLRNTGKVGFDFTALLGEQKIDSESLSPGQPLVIPKMGHIEANSEMKLSVYYIPGVPEVFQTTFKLQVAYFEPENITVRGKGVFQRICLDLPRNLDDSKYGSLLKEARDLVERERQTEDALSRPTTGEEVQPDEDYIPTYDALLQMEVERLLVKKNAMATLDPSNHLDYRETSGSTIKWRKELNRFQLPEYILDFGFVIHGSAPTHIVRVTNTGPMPVSFRADCRPLAGTGFSTELDRVKNLPHCETETFEVRFDPRGANLDLGEISAVLPIQVVRGPAVKVLLRAVVTMPSLTVSTDTLQFDSVQCGMCQVTTVQLYNHNTVPCEWTIKEMEQPQPKIDKHVPLHLRRKARMKLRPPPVVFEAQPAEGVLFPGDRVNVQVKFSPTERKSYSQRLVVTVARSTERILLLAQGQGEEPQLEFSSFLLELGPTLPQSAGEDAEVLVHNPCPFPVEFYSLEFDTQYLEEEKILRMIKGYDEQNILLLPPRAPGETLPPELLEYYEEHCSPEKEQGRTSPHHPPDSYSGHYFFHDMQPETNDIWPEIESRVSSGVGDLEMDPVSRANARYMGIDLSPEGQAARNRRGIAIIIHGAPFSGKTPTAVALAKLYSVACLSIDAVVSEAVSSGESAACLQARELCAKAAAEHAQRKEEETALAVADAVGPGALSVEALAKHTTDSSQMKESKAVPSSASTRNKTNITGSRRRDSTQPPMVIPPHYLLSSCLLLSQEILSCLLPDELLVEILSERLQLSDCYHGVVIDGLETVYCQSISSTLQIILKAFNNRRHIYMVNRSDNYDDFKAREKAERVAEETKRRQEEEKLKLFPLEMDEEEYDNLPEDEKDRIDLKYLEELREQRKEREKEEKTQQEEYEKLREEEEMRKRSKKGKKETSKKDLSDKGSQQGHKELKEGRSMPCGTESKEVTDSPTDGTREPEDGLKRKRSKRGKPEGLDGALVLPDEEDREMSNEEDRQLLSRFRLYEQSQPQVLHVLQFWDRTQGMLLQAIPLEEQSQDVEDAAERQTPSAKNSKKDREKKKAGKERVEKDRLKADLSEVKLASPAPSQIPLSAEGTEESEKEGPEIIPLVSLPVRGKSPLSGAEILNNTQLPSLEEVLDGLGLGPKGSPIPPPTVFSVVPYPKERPLPGSQLTTNCFTFVVPSPAEDSTAEKIEADVDAPPLKEEVVSPAKGRGRKAETGRESQKDRRRTPAKKGPRSPSESLSPSLTNTGTVLSDTDMSTHTGDNQQERNQRLTTFRWIVPPNGEVPLKIWFQSSAPGKFSQTFNFEVMGTKRRYQLLCRGICAYPSINKDHKTVFAHCKRVSKPEKDIQRAYIISSGLYDFGPILCGKTRERYKERKYPENAERIVMHNNSPLDTEINFCFQHDTKAATFLLDPPSMTLKPDEKKDLTVWAYPTTLGQIEDSVVCCIKENPEPVIFRFACRGVRPELEVKQKQLHFDKILLLRRDTKNLCLSNKTPLPVAWRLIGLEALGDEFIWSQQQGIVLPNSEFTLQVHFTALKPISVKRTIRIEVSDPENILGAIHYENIQVIAEAYDVALNITLPRGENGRLDFGKFRVSKEVKLSITMKNKTKHEVAYKFLLEPTDPGMPDLNSVFTITPEKGTLQPADRPTEIHIIFSHDKEVCIRDKQILRCMVIDPNHSKDGEIIAVIPIRVSVESIFSKYSISPLSDIDFGPLVYGCRRTQTITIENKGDFEFRFSIFRTCKEPLIPPKSRGGVGKRASRECHSGKPPVSLKARQSESMLNMGTQTRVSMGVFTLSPCSGVLGPRSSQVVTVECLANQAGRWLECLTVDVTDRDPSDHPDGIPYRLIADVCVPGIACEDIASIFEEHRLCKNSNMLHCEQYRNAMGIYVQDENKFVFNNVLVGEQAKARFRLTNPVKVPCKLSLHVKSALTKTAGRTSDVFELTPTKMCIPSHSHAFATVTFSPQAMQTYRAMFEASVEGAASLVPSGKVKALMFELLGEGNLPTVTVLRPALRNGRGQPVLQFKRLLVGRGQCLPLVMKNTGSVPAQMVISLTDKMSTFRLRAAPGTICRNLSSSHTQTDPGTDKPLADRFILVLKVQEQAEFEVEFRPELAQSFEASIQLVVQNNQFDQREVQLLGEGYRDIVTFDSISSKTHQDEDCADDLLHFGDCHVGRSYHETFTMTNQSNTAVLRFEWPTDGPVLHFSPRVGHLHAGCTKDVTVTFCSEEPTVLSARAMKCKLCRIILQQPVDQVPDWDDRLRTIHWVNTSQQASPQRPAKKKEIKTDPEPAHSVVENSYREMELMISAMCDYAKFTCNTEPIRFKDTMLYQTRVFQFQMVNEGRIKLEFSWQVSMETFGESICSDHAVKTPGSRQGSRASLRTASCLESLSRLMFGDADLPPFSVEPSMGFISPGAEQTFHVRFSPRKVAECEARLLCSIPNLKDGQGPVVSASGRSLLPYCHFHLEDSDYITAKRNRRLQGASLDPNTRVIEFTSVGTGVSAYRELSIMNPTNKPYSFTWRCDDPSISPFTCLTPKNSIEPGKKVEVSFEFQAQDFDLVESFWTFLIPERNLSLPFLLVGTVNDPEVYIDRAHLNLGSLLVGQEVHQTVYIVNAEEKPFQFTVQESSCHSEAFQNSLLLEPLQGSVPPKDKYPIVVSFKPCQEGMVTFNVVVKVKGKVESLCLNVKAEGYRMNAYVLCESPEGAVTELVQSKVHQVDFKMVELGDNSTCVFLVSNSGKLNLEVEYELWAPASLRRHLQVEPHADVVAEGRQSRCTVSFIPQQKCVLKDTGLKIKVKNGPTFSCSLLGFAASPELNFSFIKHDFGINFIYSDGMIPASCTLVISNKGERGISLGCLYSSTPFLEVDFIPEVLAPGASKEVLFTFYPQKAVQYHEIVVFEMNNCAKQAVEILGLGADMKIGVEDTKHKVVNLGVLRVGRKSRRVIPVVNNSHSPLTFSLRLSPSVDKLLDSRVLSVKPESEVTLKAQGGRCTVDILFSPKQRMTPFSEELLLECLGTVRPLLIFKGCCQAVEVQLDQDYLPFGAVVQRGHATRRVIMQNTGDIGAKFEWDVKRFAPDFSIKPAKGYISPGAEVPFEVTFTPVELGQDLCYNGLRCNIEGSEPVTLTLAGSCVTPPIVKEVVNFVCQVRNQQTQSLIVFNHTNQRCVLKPVIEGEHWRGPHTCILEANQESKAYEITYKPLVMTPEGIKHVGSVFFSFPDGTGVLYTLNGTAEPPKAVSTITHEIPCKTLHTQLLPVHNWLSKSQRFRAIIKLERPDNTVTLKGLDYVDVPALAKRDYQISFFAYKEGQYNAKATFLNEVTGEYLFYYLNFKATSPEVISTITMETTVRQTASASVKVENPLPNILVFNVDCRCADISVPPQLSVNGQSKGTLKFDYQPLIVGESTARLLLHNSELGSFHYKLLLKALPAPPEKPVYFSAPLGSSQHLSVNFTNYSRVEVEYTCKTDNADFTVDKSVTVAAGSHEGTEVSVNVGFEPSQLGEIRGTLTLYSSLGGEYTFPLCGTCTPPKAQGPFSIRSGTSISIPFRNIFQQATSFSLQVSNPAFTVHGVELMRPKKTHKIVVAFEGLPAGSTGTSIGTLTISSPRIEGHGQVVSWVYYLKGYSPELIQREKTS
ncbi:hydrocephalus-inducing protein homolog [Chanos chanos]|uniref:Hydrocephalus-inducing protein homolog n=1 Tax=Chanos chanos TaxID=29144 RepID=A0A6J2UPI7_CHACN|nr:hydrocephalus-inducing protein homolog [Chanos chanos]